MGDGGSWIAQAFKLFDALINLRCLPADSLEAGPGAKVFKTLFTLPLNAASRALPMRGSDEWGRGNDSTDDEASGR
jgi:hypothetical protein